VRDQRSERDPDEPSVADEGQADEDRVEPPEAVLDDPDEQVVVD
jgi:hypothetical protein